MSEDYTTIPGVDLALCRAALRRDVYRGQGNTVSADMQTFVIDRLLDRRLILAAERDAL